MTLTQSQRRHLRGLAHARKPIIMVGQAGITPGLLQELDQTLLHHELVKVKVRAGDRAARDELIDGLCRELAATSIQRIGNVATLYRANPDDPRIALPA